MFSLCAEPPQLRENDLYHLCASLNAPVVNIEALPVGPVRAAIVLYAEVDVGGSRIPQLSIGLRSLETGRVAVYRYSGEVRKLSSASRALDVALSFAEAMGFLFDDDLVGGRAGTGRVRALSLWQKLVGLADISSASELGLDGVVDSGDLDPQTAELLLGKAEGAAPAASVLLGSEPGRETNTDAANARPERDPTLRTRASDPERRGASETTPEPGSTGSTLGRVPLVRMRIKPEGAGAEHESQLLRLLASF